MPLPDSGSRLRSCLPALLQGCMLASCLLMMIAVVIVKEGRLCGRDISQDPHAPAPVTRAMNSISTTDLGVTTEGYGGPVPLTVTLGSDGRIAAVTPEPNAETPSFFRRVEQELIPRYLGMTPQEVLQARIDGVSGATFSSEAVQAGMRAAAGRLAGVAKLTADAGKTPGAPYWISLAVVLCAAILPLWTRNRAYRIVQLIVNVAVLGFWTGTFLSYTSMLHALSSGLSTATMWVTLAMLVTAFIYPFFGHKNHYCSWVCPLGSLQELAGSVMPRRLRLTLPPAAVKGLAIFRQILWGALMLVMWTQVWFAWIDWELFTAFIVESASTGVLIGAGALLLLSLFIPRPYCRFVCPTGTLFKIAQS